MKGDPFYNPPRLDPGQVARVIADEGQLRIRFDEAGYGPELLAELDQLCRTHGPALTVSFYGHHRTGFDGRSLRHLPHVSSLSVSCHRARHLGEIAALQLVHLRLEVFELEDEDLLARMPLDRLTDLAIGQTRRGKFDLRPLAACTALEKLVLEKQTLGFNAIAGLPELRELSLRSIAKGQSLGALCELPRLSRLGIGLGGRESLDEIRSATLDKLSIGGVLGLASLGDLSRFPALRVLIVDGQPKLKEIDLSQAPAGLRVLNLFTCKSLDTLGSLARFRELEDLALAFTALDLEAVLRSALPSSLRSVRLVTGKLTRDRELRALLDERGYREFPEVPEQ